MPKSIKNSLVKNDEIDVHITDLYNKISHHINNARQGIQRSVNVEMVRAYWLSGRDIIEKEQNGKFRAAYGKAILKGLSAKLTEKYGRGFSVDTLEKTRKFYVVFSTDIKSATLSRNSDLPNFSANISWSHYEVLMRLPDALAREFYIIEANKNNWSVRELKRQINSLLFDRLSQSKNKDELIRLSLKGQEINNPSDTIKDPVVLEFLDIPESHKAIESKLEEALINNLQKFMLELGKGFAYVGRQQRLTLNGDHFYADLVFFSIPLKAYVIIDIKVEELTHGDLGQMLLYVNYYDKEVKTDNENPTIGLVLCTGKNHKMVEYLLSDKSKQIFASTYQFHLPTKTQLERELKREIEEFKLLEESDEVLDK